MDVVFENRHVRAFEFLSHDKNPLHTDPIYSRSTQFGRPIVFGMCAVVRALAEWANDRSFALVQIKGRFILPLFENTSYELRIREHGQQVTIDYIRSQTVQMTTTFIWSPRAPLHAQPAAPVAFEFKPRDHSNEDEAGKIAGQWQTRTFPYSYRTASVSENLSTLGLSPHQLPDAQLNALLGSSYLVGMEIPGKQALYTAFEFNFESQEKGSVNRFEFANISAKHDERFNRIVLSGSGTGIQSFVISAFARPRPVRYSVDEVKAAIDRLDTAVFRNKVALITGASRGFGAILVKCLGLSGATVFVNYLSSGQEASGLATELESSNNRIFPVQGDVTSSNDCERLRESVLSRSPQVDLLICNASPLIPSRKFLEQTESDFLGFLQRSTAATITPIRALLPLLPSKALVLLVSSSYVQEPTSGFSHYIAAKAALEALFRCLAIEFPALNFLVVRPPRMLTDQTNVPFDLSAPASPVAVGCALLESIGNGCFQSESNFAILDLAVS